MAKGEIKINRDKCKGCQICVEFCPKRVIAVSKTLNDKGYYPAEFRQAEGKEGCTGCTTCFLMCPDLAIEVYRG